MRLRNEPGARLTLIQDSRERLLLARTSTVSGVLGAVRAHGAAAFGPEQRSAATVLAAGD